MQIRTAKELGALIKDRRHALKLSQSDLARRVGVSRLWIVELERGKTTAQISLVLRTLKALNVPMQASITPTTDAQRADAIDLDAIIQRTKASRP